MSEAYEQLEKLANDLGLTMLFEYQPHKYPPGHDPNKMQLRWKCKVMHKSKALLETDYFQGSGFCDGAPKGLRMTVAEAEAIKQQCEQGPKRLQPVRPFDALWNICMDIMGVEQNANFESWAEEFGYSPDSRKAHAIWQQIMEQSHALRASIGMDAIQRIAEVPL